MFGLMLGMALFFGTPALAAEAAEYTVTAAEAVLYTNENTVILWCFPVWQRICPYRSQG